MRRAPFPIPPGGREADEVLADALVERLRPHLPHGYDIVVDRHGGTATAVVIDPHGPRSGTSWFHVEADDELIAYVAGRAEATLDQIQDNIAEGTGDPWPGSDRLPPPFVLVTSDALRLGYGSPDDPILELRPLPRSRFTA